MSQLSKDAWLKQVQGAAREKGGQCFAEVYVNANVPLPFVCGEGHKWSARPAAVLRGTWCAKCASVQQHKPQRTPFIVVEELVRNRQGQLHSTEDEYLNRQTKLRITCDKEHHFTITLDSLKAGCWCNKCGRISAAKKLTLDISVAQALALSRGGLLLSAEYQRNAALLEWKCKAGHTWKAQYANVVAGTWCRKCSGLVSISESIVRAYLEAMTGIKFPSCWPEWLINDDGNQMELDGFNEEYKCAFEHHGTQHYRETKFYAGESFIKRVADDEKRNAFVLKTTFGCLRSGKF